MRLEQHFETFLSEVVVVRQNLADAALAQTFIEMQSVRTLAFVGPCFVESEAGDESVVMLWNDFDVGVAEDSLYLSDRATPGSLALL